jgi:hypothetical protein
MVVTVACGGQPHYLGAPLPAACTDGDLERCAGWMAERDLVAGQIDVYADEVLRAYVQAVTDRLARGSTLVHSPRVVVGDHDGTYAAFGERIVIGRRALERLGSEAELAAIIAHELVHVEGHHAALSLHDSSDDRSWLVARRDAEAIADERAVTLLERAGYAPGAMERALSAVLEIDDEEHPRRDDRLAAVHELAEGRPAGFEGRRELLAQLEGMIVGRNTTFGTRIGDAWVIAALGVALDLPAKHVVHVDGDALILRRGRSALTAYAIGTAWATELASSLADHATANTSLGPLTVGLAPAPPSATTPIAKLQRAVRELLPQPLEGTWVVVLQRERGGLVLELGNDIDPVVRDQWLGSLRPATARELDAAQPARIQLHTAPTRASVRDLVSSCPDPRMALRLDEADRTVEAGEPFKCTDR